MPSVDENYEFWNNRYLWAEDRGDVWSREWGGPQTQWDWCIFPRIRQHLPAEVILEIGPGQGRWTQFLRSFCRRLMVVDISERCIDVCRERFGTDQVSYQVNDGRSLDFAETASVDFVFSFESLIHTEADDLEAYFQEISRVLKPDGKAFLHHSNLGAHAPYFRFVNGFPQAVREALQSRGVLDFDGWRAATVSHTLVQELASAVGLGVKSQELVPWGGKRLIDCFTTITKEVASEPKILENYQFVKRAGEIRRLARAYRCYVE